MIESQATKSTIVAKVENDAINEGEHDQKLVESQRGSNYGEKIGPFDNLEQQTTELIDTQELQLSINGQQSQPVIRSNNPELVENPQQVYNTFKEEAVPADLLNVQIPN